MSKGLLRSRQKGGKLAPVIRKAHSLKDVLLSVTDPGAADGFGSAAIFKFPKGNIVIHAAVLTAQIRSTDADVSATWTGNIAVGTTATADATLTGTDANICPSMAIGAATAKVSPLVRPYGTNNTNGNLFDNTAGGLQAYINMNVADASLAGAADFLIDGSFELVYTIFGE